MFDEEFGKYLENDNPGENEPGGDKTIHVAFNPIPPGKSQDGNSDMIQEYLGMLESNDPRKRFEACEKLRLTPLITDTAITALRIHLKDPIPSVGYAALQALAAHGLNVIPNEPQPAQINLPFSSTQQIPMQISEAVPPMTLTHTDTKTCPFCAETIKFEAIVCRYCGRNLTANSESPKTPRKDPSTGISLLFGLLLLVAIYGIAFFIAWNWSGSSSDLETVMGLYQLGTMFVITILAVPGLNPEKRGFLRYIGIFMLSIIPIAGWIVIFWAGKGIARSLTQK